MGGEDSGRIPPDNFGREARVLSGLSIANLVTYLASGGVLLWALDIILDIRDTGNRAAYEVSVVRKIVDDHNTEFTILRNKVHSDEKAAIKHAVHVEGLRSRVDTLEQIHYGELVSGNK